jgi:hypothetical protein
VCRQVAAAHLDADGVPLGYEQVWIFGREGGIQVKCTVA